MSEETRDEWAREWIGKLFEQASSLADKILRAAKFLEDHEKRIKALETARHNQPPN